MSVVRLLSRSLARAAAKPTFSIQSRFLSGLHDAPRMDLTHMWNVGSFPLVDDHADEAVFDTTGMLSSLPDPFPMFRYPTVPQLIDGLTSDVEYRADSVLRKRRKKMNKHKHKKRKKALRNRTKKN
ncbi:Aste57867_24878 [Aphanomyces stellatus]|uniref:Aste57867_24878 protein n=1 Tax=Aphanomyces stellatus TaxID=120398 RepID=A0A485LRP3_9STRA|nr:hypothetical protein As57867_024800 [Aphanomyces stellatus]VFU01512.1 Aste57867_24878 [Aphanomyces stellatus]